MIHQVIHFLNSVHIMISSRNFALMVVQVVKASLWKRQQEERKRYGGIFERLSKMDEREASCNAAQVQDDIGERSEQ